MYKASFIYAFVHFSNFHLTICEMMLSKGIYSYIKLLSNRVMGSFLSPLWSHLVCTVQERRQCKQNRAVHTTTKGIDTYRYVLFLVLTLVSRPLATADLNRLENTKLKKVSRAGTVKSRVLLWSQRNNLWFRSSIQQWQNLNISPLHLLWGSHFQLKSESQWTSEEKGLFWSKT